MSKKRNNHDRCIKMICDQERKAALKIRQACTVVEIGDILVICSGKVKILKKSMNYID